MAIPQIKTNVINSYSGSLAWTNSYTPGTTPCDMAWIVVMAIDKYLLKISPKRPEFRRGMLYAVKPVAAARCCRRRASPTWCSSARSATR